MPNLPAHIDLAWQAADRLGNSPLVNNPGYFLLGAVSPDVRAITKRDRAEYHYAPLTFAEVGDGVRGLFAAHPKLRDKARNDEVTTAFVAGYVTHILLDESWITGVFRPHFDLSYDDAYSKVMDRALQLELDRLAKQNVERAMPTIRAATMPIGTDLIPADTMEEYRDFVIGHLDQGFSWQRLRFMARRIANGNEDHPANQIAEEFLEAMPESFESLFERVSREELAEFRGMAVDLLAEALEEYLS